MKEKFKLGYSFDGELVDDDEEVVVVLAFESADSVEVALSLIWSTVEGASAVVGAPPADDLVAVVAAKESRAA
jgi:hypothetical protein